MRGYAVRGCEISTSLHPLTKSLDKSLTKSLNKPLDRLLTDVRACTLCAAHLPQGPRPVLQAHRIGDLKRNWRCSGLARRAWRRRCVRGGCGRLAGLGCCAVGRRGGRFDERIRSGCILQDCRRDWPSQCEAVARRRLGPWVKGAEVRCGPPHRRSQCWGRCDRGLSLRRGWQHNAARQQTRRFRRFVKAQRGWRQAQSGRVQ